MALTNGQLPKTIEQATIRYLHIYETYFNGPAEEMQRLRDLAHASICHMRRKVPNFYENHLPTIVNQAASALLTHDTKTADGSRKFHETHRNFLRVLDELKKSQPAGEIDFQTEVKRILEKEAFKRQHIQLRDKINELEAAEIACDDIGNELEDACYNKVFSELDKTKKELKKVSIMIAKLDGENIDFSTEFKLLIKEGSALERLSKNQQKNLEGQIIEYLKEHDNKKRSMYVDKSIIDGMIAKLSIQHLSQVELNDLSKDALDAYKQHYRNIEEERRKEFHESLLANVHLKPKEGIVYKSADDLPEEIIQKLDQSNRRYKRKLEECIDEYARRQPENLDENASADVVEDDDDSSDDGVEFLRKIEAEAGHMFKRVKEEPRDDYDNEAPSDDEVIVSSETADEIEGLQSGTAIANASPNYATPQHRYESTSPGSEHEDSPPSERHFQNGTSNQSQEEFEVLGLVAPQDKIPVIEIDDD